MDEDLREQLAELEHEQWVKWSQNLMSQLLDDVDPNDSFAVRNNVLKKHQRWLALWKPYDELSEEDKDKDRIWADKVLKIIKSK